jgi:hypothetical protein
MGNTPSFGLFPQNHLPQHPHLVVRFDAAVVYYGKVVVVVAATRISTTTKSTSRRRRCLFGPVATTQY